jgi:nitrogen fixation/metabolism regulation signal transduction histidine kinase
MMRRWLPFIAGAGIVIWVTALVMLALTAQGPQRFGELYLAILLINVAGVVALLILIGRRLADFIRDWRRHVPGSRLRGRTLLMFGGLAIAPLLLVFTFSVMFLTPRCARGSPTRSACRARRSTCACASTWTIR